MNGPTKALLAAIITLLIATACRGQITIIPTATPIFTPIPPTDTPHPPDDPPPPKPTTPAPTDTPIPPPDIIVEPDVIVEPECELSVLIEPVDSGYVEFQGSGIVTSGGATPVKCNDQLNLTARPSDDSHWKFARWEGDVGGPQAAQAILMDTSKVARAVFECVGQYCIDVPPTPPTFQLTINNVKVSGASVSAPNGRVDLSDAPTGPDALYPENKQVVLTPKPNTGFVLAQWAGACNDAGSCVVTMDRDQSVTAVFDKASYPLIMNGSPVTVATVRVDNGTVTISPAPNAPGGGFTHGTKVTLKIDVAPGYEGNCVPTSVTMPSSQSVTCVAAQGSHPLLVNGSQVTGSTVRVTSGTVTVSPPPNASRGEYLDETSVTFGYQPSKGYEIRCSPNPVSMTSETNVTCTATAASYPLSINGSQVIGSSSSVPNGTVTVSPPPNAPGGEYRHGTSVSLSLITAQGYHGECSAGFANMTAPQNVSCDVTKLSFQLSINGSQVAGSSVSVSNGTVTVSPPPNAPGSKYWYETPVSLRLMPFIGHEGVCSPSSILMTSGQRVSCDVTKLSYPLAINGSPVTSSSASVTNGTVSVSPPPNAPGSRYWHDTQVRLSLTPFLGHTGNCNPSSIIMTSDQVVDCPVTKNSYLLTINGGPVTSSSVSVTKGTVAIFPAPNAPGERYWYETQVSLSLSPLPGNSGTCDRTLVIMTSDQSVTCSSVAESYPLRVNGIQATGSSVPVTNGTINLSIAPNAAGNQYTSGTSVTLTAVADVNYFFAGWSGPCSGTGACILTIDQSKSVTAAFSLIIRYDLTITCSGSGSVSSPGCSTTTSLTSGSQVSLTATPAQGNTFSGWSGVCGGTGSCVLTMSSAKSVTANFAEDIPPDSGKIVFHSGRTGRGEIYVMDADGSNQIQLTDIAGGNVEPHWSPDGNKIAFETSRDGNGEVYVMNADGTNQVNLTNSGGTDNRSSWSPDGSKIAFVSHRHGEPEIYVMNADGSNQIRLTNNGVNDDIPAWSPDGTKIAFNSKRDGDQEIYVMNTDGSNVIQLTFNTSSDQIPAWSPDGTKITFDARRDGDSEVYVMNSDGSNQIRLTNSADYDGGAAWSPDGTKIVFSSCRLSCSDIFVMNSDGSNQNVVPAVNANGASPDW